MSGKKLAIAVIHGIGSQGVKRPDDSAVPSFSKDLHKALRKRIGRDRFDNDIAWREIFWSHLMQSRQEKYLRRIKNVTRWHGTRNFVLRNLADAASYRFTGQTGSTYDQVHDIADEVIGQLEADCTPDARLIVLAHSLGGHVMSNHIYDRRDDKRPDLTRFQQMKRMGAFVTFGCNIPVFLFAHPPDGITPISYPGVDLPQSKHLRPWWRNYYDRDDVLGYPLRFISDSYGKLYGKAGDPRPGELFERSINAGGLFSSWNPASHNAYWKDADLHAPVEKVIRDLL